MSIDMRRTEQKRKKEKKYPDVVYLSIITFKAMNNYQ